MASFSLLSAVVTASASSRLFVATRSFHVLCGRSVRTAFSPRFMKWPNSPAAMKPELSSSSVAQRLRSVESSISLGLSRSSVRTCS